MPLVWLSLALPPYTRLHTAPHGAAHRSLSLKSLTTRRSDCLEHSPLSDVDKVTFPMRYTLAPAKSYHELSRETRWHHNKHESTNPARPTFAVH